MTQRGPRVGFLLGSVLLKEEEKAFVAKLPLLPKHSPLVLTGRGTVRTYSWSEGTDSKDTSSSHLAGSNYVGTVLSVLCTLSYLVITILLIF